MHCARNTPPYICGGHGYILPIKQEGPMTERQIFALTGADRQSFLQGLVSNDISRLAQGPVYAALLTPQGKYLADFFVIDGGDRLLVDVAAPLAAGLMQRLSMYKLRADVQISATDLAVVRGTQEVSGPPPAGALPDPRHPALGWRLYGPADALPAADATDWDALRVAHAIPETGIELIPNDSYILEMGFERLHGVDFRKGCYVGQEVTARMKHKTELKKGLATLAIHGTAPLGTEITAEGKTVGTLYTQAGGQALAYLRQDRVAPRMQAGEATLSPL
jgi:tRNA-modifying protein YgfZ